MHRRTLVLNASYEPLVVVSLRRAMVLVISEKAEVVDADGEVRSAQAAYALPRVIRLLRYVRVPYRRRVPLTRRAVLARDDGRCAYCGGRASTVDHVQPRSRGGLHVWTNVVAACSPCNGRKADRTPAEAGMPLSVVPAEPAGTTAVWVVFGACDDAWEPYLAAA